MLLANATLTAGVPDGAEMYRNPRNLQVDSHICLSEAPFKHQECREGSDPMTQADFREHGMQKLACEGTYLKPFENSGKSPQLAEAGIEKRYG